MKGLLRAKDEFGKLRQWDQIYGADRDYSSRPWSERKKTILEGQILNTYGLRVNKPGKGSSKSQIQYYNDLMRLVREGLLVRSRESRFSMQYLTMVRPANKPVVEQKRVAEPYKNRKAAIQEYMKGVK